MASLMELIERVNRGDLIDPAQLEIYQESSNSAEKFLAHHAHAMLDLRRAQQHMMQSLEAIDYSDQKVLNQFISVSGFLGLTDLRAGPVVKFGACAIGRREYALGLEAIQNGVSYDLQHGGAWTSDRENCQFIATQYDRAAQCINWTGERNTSSLNEQTNVAVVVSSIGDEDASGKMIRALAKYHDSRRFRLKIYSTEAGVRREKQLFGQSAYLSSSAKRGPSTLNELSRRKIATWQASVEGDLVTAARDLATQMVKDQVDVVLIDASQADPIAALIAAWDTAPIKVNLARRGPLYASNISSITYLDPVKFESDRDHWQKKGIDARFILEGIDIDADHGPLPLRAQYGIPENAIVLATASQDLDQSLSAEFVDTIINILRAHPHAIYLLVGEGELAWQKRKFESSGVAKRIGYAGKRKDLPGFLRIADAYLAEFPTPNATGVLQAMSVERAVVTLKRGDGGGVDGAEQSQAATLVGSDGTVAGKDPGVYIERVSKIIRDADFRQNLGKMMRSRVEQHFSFAQTTRHLEQLFEQLIQQRAEAEAGRIITGGVTIGETPTQGTQSIAEVA